MSISAVEGKKVLEIHLIPIFYFSIFWTFFLNFGLSNNLLLSILSCSLISFSLFKILDYENYLTIRVRFKDLLLIFFLLIIFWFVNFNFRFSVNSDQLFHLLTTYQIPIGILKILGIDFVANNLNISANLFFHLYSIFTLIAFLAIYSLYVFGSKKLFLTIFIFISLTCLLTKFLFNPTISHPELRTLPISLLGSIKIENNVFRLQGLLACLIFLIYLRRIMPLKEFIFAFIVIASCPLFFFTVPLIEFSIWAFVFNSILLIEILRLKNTIELKHVLILSVLLCLASLIRQSISFSFIPLIFYLLLIKEYKLLKVSLIFFLISFCQVLNSIVDGYSAIQTSDTYFLDINVGSFSIFDKLILSFNELVLKNIFLNLTLIYTFLFLISLFLGRLREKLFLICFLVTTWLVYHQISPQLWGWPRYLLEYLLPLATVSIFYLLTKYSSYKKIVIFSILIISVLNTLIITNQFSQLKVFSPFDYNRETIREISRSKIESKEILISEEVYNWNSAIQNIPEKCYGRSVMNIHLGVFPLALNKKVSLSQFLSSYIVSSGQKPQLGNYLCEYQWSVGTDGLSYNEVWNTNIKLSLVNGNSLKE